MPIPDYQSLMLPVLRLVGDRQEHSLAEMRQRIADELHLTEEDPVPRHGELAVNMAGSMASFLLATFEAT